MGSQYSTRSTVCIKGSPVGPLRVARQFFYEIFSPDLCTRYLGVLVKNLVINNLQGDEV